MERRGKSPSFHNKARKKREKQEKIKVAKTQKKGMSGFPSLPLTGYTDTEKIRALYS